MSSCDTWSTRPSALRKRPIFCSGVVLGSRLDFMRSIIKHLRLSENKMNTYVDFAVCPCGERSAIQPTKPVIPDENPQPSGSVEGWIVVACAKCKRIYRFDTGNILSIPTERGLAPHNPDSRI